MFDYNAPQFIDFDESNHEVEDTSSFFDTHHLSQERETKKTPRCKDTLAPATSAKKHSMTTRQDSNDSALELRSRSVSRECKLATESTKKSSAKASLKNHAINTLTLPVTPMLLTKFRKRPTAVLPYEDQVLLQVDEYNKSKAFPVPLNKTVLENPPTIVLPHTHTVPQPFNITKFEVKEKPESKPEVFVFKSQPVPSSLYKPCGVVRPFTLKEKYLMQKRKEKLQESASDENKKPFRAKRAKVLQGSPFIPSKSTKAPTKPKNIILQTAVRAEIRAAFNARRSLRESKLQEFDQKLREEQEKEMALYRKSLVHKALPVPEVVRRVGSKRKFSHL